MDRVRFLDFLLPSARVQLQAVDIMWKRIGVAGALGTSSRPKRCAALVGE